MTIETWIDADFYGCILIRKSEHIIFQKAFGYADMPNKVPNTLETKFPTASAGKVFVATAILQLIEQQKLSFEDTIGQLLSHIDWKLIDTGITVRQLLNHTSGIPDYFDESVMEEYAELWRDYPNYKIRTSADLLPLFINKEMMYPRGEKFQYNNTGYVVLGLIIEQVSEKPFDEYLQYNVFQPSGMIDTGYFELDRLPARTANAYIYDEAHDEYYTNIYSIDVKGTGAGGVFTTVLDIDKFWRKLLAGDLISLDMLQQMLSLQGEDEHSNYGYGVWLTKRDFSNTKVEDATFIPHFEGCDPGVSFKSSYDIANDITITIVSNAGNDVWDMHRKIKDELVKNGTLE
ncbi:serine hydrolase [Paenibacillus turicensis]|uniref:serine hydrolase domain-containing protein n=1 Tax=Paenibacillus turicensis TaxID=160487 RepID=UPI003D26DD6D